MIPAFGIASPPPRGHLLTAADKRGGYSVFAWAAPAGVMPTPRAAATAQEAW